MALAPSLMAEEISKSNFIKGPEVIKTSEGKIKVEFTVDTPTDVEIAILNSKGMVVRHLAAGVLGKSIPPPEPLKPGLTQSIIWDGEDDYGKSLPLDDCTIRVRIGMGVKLNKILGGDPYAFFSNEIQHHNHSLWSIAGIDTKPDGSVYVFGTGGQQGPYTVRQFNADGDYIRTVFPIPSGMPINKISGWGINRLEDGSYAPSITNGLSSWPCYSKTVINFMQSGFGPQPILLPTALPNTLTIAGASKLDLLNFNTDSSIDPDPKIHTSAHLVQEPPLLSWETWDNPTLATGAIYTCPTIDGKSFYLSGICRTDSKPFWRPGQVWKVDYETRTAKPWYALPAEKVASGFDIKQKSYTPLQGVAVDNANHVFVCDRLNNRVSVLSDDATLVRDIAVTNPDDVAYDMESKALYVTTRFGRQGATGNVQLLRFDNWEKDTQPSLTMMLCINDMVILPRERTYIKIVGAGEKKRIWIGYKDLPVRIYREKGKELELVRDFYQSGQKLRYLAFRSMVVDPVTDTAYFASGCSDVWKLKDWEKADFRQCRDTKDQPKGDTHGRSTHPRQIFAADVAIDSRNRYLFTRQCNNDLVYRWALDGEDHARAPVGNANIPAYSDTLIMNEWAGSLYFDRGMWPSPDGGMFTLSGTPRINYLDVHLFYHPIDPNNGPGKCEAILKLGEMCAGLRVDRKGRIYIGVRLPNDTPKPPAGFADDWAYKNLMGKIVMYEPTGTKEKLYPTQPKGPAKVYDVHFGHISRDSGQIGFSPRFGVDEYGRICYTNTLSRNVSLMDNAGNEILRFGTYGNIDNWKELEGRWSETKTIPLSWPGSVDATDGWIYVADHANNGVLRLEKTFKETKVLGLK